ncbi:MAG: citrate lyase acyl carrier protein [Bacteroidales bacterium]
MQSAQAGTFESSDILILVEPVSEKSGRIIELNSSVETQYGEQILNDITQVLDRLEVKDIHIIARDKGALTPTIQARVETAIKRAIANQGEK